MGEEHCAKLALFCNVPVDLVIEEPDVKHSIYEVPLELAQHGLDAKVLDLLRFTPTELDLTEYRRWLDGVLHPTRHCTVALVGKYATHKDAYKSFTSRSITPASPAIATSRASVES